MEAERKGRCVFESCRTSLWEARTILQLNFALRWADQSGGGREEGEEGRRRRRGVEELRAEPLIPP